MVEFKPTPKQWKALEVLSDSTTSEIGWGGAAGAGKSYLGCTWIVLNCLQYPGVGYAIARKELTTLKKTTILTLFQVFKMLGIKESGYNFNQQTNVITLANGSQIFFVDLAYKPSDPLYTRLGGLELTGDFIDESNECPEEAVKMLHTRIGRRLNEQYHLLPKSLETFNPSKNHVYMRFYKLWRDGNLPERRVFIPALPTDNPHLAQSYIEQLKNSDPVTRARLLEGNFEYDDDPLSLFQIDNITDLFTNTITPTEEKYIIVDVARFGKDRSVISYWKGLILEDIKILRTQSLDITAENVKEMERTYQVPRSCVLIDEDGIGGGLVDMLKGSKGFTANSPPLETFGSIQSKMIRQNYRNFKAQCWFKLSELVEQHQIAIANNDRTKSIRQTLVEELGAMKARPRSDSEPLNVISKEDLKETIGRSTDVADIFMMRMYFVFKPKQAIMTRGTFGRISVNRVSHNF